MKIIYMGTPDFAVPPLQAIIDAGHEVLAVATQPDKQKGRGREIKCSPVKEFALTQNLTILQPLKIKAEDAVMELKRFGADIYVIVAYGQILSAEILRLPRYGCINIHASLLPKYRGAAPIQRAIISGEKETGITIQQMDQGVDTGDILFTKKIELEKCETSDSLHHKLSLLGAELIVEALVQIEKGEVNAIKQNHEEASHAPMISRDEGKIKWQTPAVKIERLIRGLHSRPGAYTDYHNKTLKIWAADSVSRQSETAKPGTIMDVTKDSIIVACGEGCLAITELQIEGKKKMSVRDFLLGYNISAGEMMSETID